MASKFPPGWYPVPTGEIGYWDGKGWSSQLQPAAPADNRVGWHLQETGLFRWWLGNHWSEALAAPDSRVDVAQGVGQKVICVSSAYLQEEALARFHAELAEFPPCRIVQLTMQADTASPGLVLVAVVEWDSPVG